MDLQRRNFIKQSLAGFGAVAACGGVKTPSALSTPAEGSYANRKNPFSTDPNAQVLLTPGVKTSRIGFGTGMSGYQRSAQLTRMDRNKAVALLNHAYDRGIRFFDCADLYGTHEIVSTTFKDKPRDSYTLTSKIWIHSGGIPEKERPSADVVVKRFLKELNTDYIDVLQLHCMMKPNWSDELQSYRDDLERLKEQGLIRSHGVSCHSLGAIETGASDPWVDSMHIRLNATGARMDGSFEENVAAARLAQENSKGIICMKLIGEGTIKDKDQRLASLEKVVEADVVDVYIVGFEEIWQVDEFYDHMEIALKKAEAQRASVA